MTDSFQRVRKIQYGNQAAWRKQYADQGRRKRMAVLRWIARRLGANALLAPIPLSPKEACATELAMITRLKSLGVLVPDVLEAGETHLVLSDIGVLFSAECRRRKSLGERSALLRDGFEAINDLHRRGGYLSQAFARNLTEQEGRIGFIDLEEDPVKVMSLHAAQARDIIFYVHSTARFMSDSPQEYSRLFESSLSQLPSEIKVEIAKVVPMLKWLEPCTRILSKRARMAGMAWRQLIGMHQTNV